ncbi:glycosyl hydrolase family 7-domain-containing protein [Daedaleopsis nitida]|nr:glycosyl hydrolase family 7-domain-containing protein [Daedaleopsis nitida]
MRAPSNGCPGMHARLTRRDNSTSNDLAEDSPSALCGCEGQIAPHSAVPVNCGQRCQIMDALGSKEVTQSPCISVKDSEKGLRQTRTNVLKREYLRLQPSYAMYFFQWVSSHNTPLSLRFTLPAASRDLFAAPRDVLVATDVNFKSTSPAMVTGDAGAAHMHTVCPGILWRAGASLRTPLDPSVDDCQREKLPWDPLLLPAYFPVPLSPPVYKTTSKLSGSTSSPLDSSQALDLGTAMFPSVALLALSYLAIAYGQQAGTLQAETHPKMTIQKCSAGKSCTTENHSIVLDSNWRWLHSTSGSNNCYTGNTWDTSLCPDATTCAKNCALDGADYPGTYGITTSGNALTLKFVTHGQYSTNIGSRVYLMDTSDQKYQTFNLKNQEFTFDIDMSKLPCGLNGALYFVEMDADGGTSRFSGNKAGAKYGTGYCDTQCPHDIKFINGEGNVEDWEPSPNDSNAGTGKYGACCNEMDIWEANSQGAAYTPHVCSVAGQVRCEGNDCGDGDNRYGGICDKDGCDFNSWRMGDQTFLGTGKTVDTSQKFTVVTQFLTSNNSTSGTLSEIRRLYVQNGKVIANSKTNVSGLSAYDSVTDDFCNKQKVAFGDTNSFEKLGGLKVMGDSFQKGMVLVMSIWDDHEAKMLWLDSEYPLDKDGSTPGVSRGPCSRDSGDPKDVEANSPDATVVFSNIKYGPIGSTY